MSFDQNIFAVGVSGLFFFIAGGLWYAAIFSKTYQDGLSFSEEVKKQAEKDFPKALVVHFISGIIISFVIANINQAMNAMSFIDGMITGFWLWLGFALTLHLISFMFEKRALSVFVVNAGFYLVSFVIMGGVLAIWQ